MPISEQIKWGLGPSCAARQGVTAPAGPGQSPGLPTTGSTLSHAGRPSLYATNTMAVTKINSARQFVSNRRLPLCNSAARRSAAFLLCERGVNALHVIQLLWLNH